MKEITGFVLLRDCAGAAVPVAGRTLYAQPRHPEALFMDGTAWAPAYVNEAITVPGFSRAIKCQTGITGQFSFKLPQASETLPTTSNAWLITDPVSGLTFSGDVTDALPSPIDVRVLVQTYGWVVVPTIQVSLGAANLRTDVISFDQSTGLQRVIDLVPPMPNASYSPSVSGATDDLSDLNYSAFVVPGWTASQVTIRIGAVPPVGRTVKVPLIIIG